VPWAEFCSAFCTHHTPVGVMRRKYQEFMDQKQCAKLFNHLTQYAPDQVHTYEKKKKHFRNGLSTKLQECMELNTGQSFPEFVSNVIIAHDVTCAHKETKKRKDVAAPSGSAPPKY
jgi:hypothetical protein